MSKDRTVDYAVDEILVVYKKSDLELYVRERKNERYQRLLDASGAVMEPLVRADRAHKESLDRIVAAVESQGLKPRLVYRARLKPEDTKGRVVVTVGGDGTLLDASRRVTEGVVLGVNSDPARSVGFLCAATVDTFAKVMAKVVDRTLSPTRVHRMQVTLDGETHRLPVLNDILITHKNPAATVRYELTLGKRTESHRSSGIWIAAAAGTTAGIYSAGGKVTALDDKRLQYRVRELYPLGGKMTLAAGFLDEKKPLTVRSTMREGVIYLDGPHEKILFPVDSVLVVDNRAPPLMLFVTDDMRARRAALMPQT